jgi:hypothetical protein
LVVIAAKIKKQKITYPKNSETDILVSDLVVISTIPISLAYLILGTGSLPLKLLVVLAELLFAGLLIKGVEEYAWRREFTRHYQGADKIVAIVFSLVGLVSPSWNFVASATRSTSRLGKYLFTLALPLAAGLALTLVVRRLGMGEFMGRVDSLIAIATLGLVLNVTIEIMEHVFRTSRWHLSGLLRVALGIVIIFALSK